MARSCCQEHLPAPSQAIQRMARQAECRVESVLVSKLIRRHAVKRLVSTDIEGPDRHWQTTFMVSIASGAVGVVLLFFVGKFAVRGS